MSPRTCALILPLLLLPAACHVAQAADSGDSRALDRAIDGLELQVDRLEGARAV
jgi:hypothetical protein